MAETEKRKLILINEAALDELVSLQDAITIVDKAMRDYSAGHVGSPQRAVTLMFLAGTAPLRGAHDHELSATEWRGPSQELDQPRSS